READLAAQAAGRPWLAAGRAEDGEIRDAGERADCRVPEIARPGDGHGHHVPPLVTRRRSESPGDVAQLGPDSRGELVSAAQGHFTNIAVEHRAAARCGQAAARALREDRPLAGL